MNKRHLSVVHFDVLYYQEDPLEKEMATYSSILTRESHGQSLVGYSPWGHKESDMTEWLNTSVSFCVYRTGEEIIPVFPGFVDPIPP